GPRAALLGQLLVRRSRGGRTRPRRWRLRCPNRRSGHDGRSCRSSGGSLASCSASRPPCSREAHPRARCARASSTHLRAGSGLFLRDALPPPENRPAPLGGLAANVASAEAANDLVRPPTESPRERSASTWKPNH